MLIIFFCSFPPSSSSKQIKSETIFKLYFNAKVRALYPVQMGRPINHCHGVFSYAHQCVIFYLAFTTLYHKCGIYIFLYRCLIILGMNTLALTCLQFSLQTACCERLAVLGEVWYIIMHCAECAIRSVPRFC